MKKKKVLINDKQTNKQTNNNNSIKPQIKVVPFSAQLRTEKKSSRIETSNTFYHVNRNAWTSNKYLSPSHSLYLFHETSLGTVGMFVACIYTFIYAA